MELEPFKYSTDSMGSSIAVSLRTCWNSLQWGGDRRQGEEHQHFRMAGPPRRKVCRHGALKWQWLISTQAEAQPFKL